MASLWSLACPTLQSGLQKNGGVQKYVVFPTAYSETWFSLLFGVAIRVLRNFETSRNLYANKQRR
jgi:hypothetical protein